MKKFSRKRFTKKSTKRATVKEVKYLIKKAVEPITNRCYVDFCQSGICVPTVTRIAPILVPTQGTSPNQRNGDTIYITGYEMSLVIEGPELITSSPMFFVSNVGIKILHAIKNNGSDYPAGLGINGLYDITSMTATGANQLNFFDAPVGWDLSGTYKIEKHLRFQVSSLSTGAAFSNQAWSRDHTKRIFLKKHYTTPKKCTFNSSVNQIQSFNQYCPIIAIMGDSALTSQSSKWYIWTRFYFNN